MIIDKQGKLFGKINIIDLLIVVIFIAAIALVGYKMLTPVTDENGVVITGKEECEVTFEFYSEEVSEFVLDGTIKKGDTVIEVGTENVLGKITDIEIADSVSYAADREGKWVTGAKPNHKSIRITCQGTAEPYDHGCKIKGAKYYIGHTLTIAAGKAKLYLRISDIDYENQEQK